MLRSGERIGDVLVSRNGTLEHHWSMPSTGVTITDSVGSNNMTVRNGPGDDSNWIQLPEEASGNLVSDQYTLDGNASVGNDATGNLQADDSTLAGTSTVTHTSIGALVSDQYTLDGEADAGINAFGNLVADDSTLSGTSVRTSTSSGNLQSDNYTLDGDAVSDASLTVDNVIDNRVYQREVAATTTFTISGTYVGPVGSVEARVMRGTTEVVAWTEIDDSPLEGNYSGTIEIPPGPNNSSATWYNVEVRGLNSSSVVIATESDSNEFGIGDVVGIIGSSSPERWFTQGTGTANTQLRRFNENGWSELGTTGTGALGYGTALAAETGYPVGLMDYGISGSRTNQWITPGGSQYSPFRTGLTTLGNNIAGVMILLGYNDANAVSNFNRATHLANTRTLITNIRSSANGVDDANLPIFIIQSQRGINRDDDDFTALHLAEQDVVEDANVYYTATSIDLEISNDNIHLTDDAYELQGQRSGQVTGDILEGNDPIRRGPVIAGLTRISNTTLRVHLDFTVGDNWTSDGTAGGLQVFDDDTDTELSISLVAESNSDIVIAHTSTANRVRVLYGYGAEPFGGDLEVTDAIYGNDTDSLPLEFGSALAPITSFGNLESDDYSLSGTSTVTHAASGNLASDNYTLAGTSVVTHTSSGNLASDNYTLSGTATTTHTSSGNLVASDSVLDGQAATDIQADGNLVSDNYVLAGTAVTTHTSSGNLVSDQYTLSGTATRQSTSSGNLVSDQYTLTGVSVRQSVASGNLVSDQYTLSATAVRQSSASGNLVSDSYTLDGTALVGLDSTGNLVSDNYVLAGVSVRESTSSGNLQSDNYTLLGSSLRTSTSSGNLQSDNYTLSGTATRISTSTGNLVSDSYTLDGNALVGLSATGNLVADDSTLSGTATSIHVASGNLQASDSTLTGDSSVGIVSSGNLQVSDSVLTGTSVKSSSATGNLISTQYTLTGVSLVSHPSSGNLVSSDYTLDGNVVETGTRVAEGSLISDDYVLSGGAFVVSTTFGAFPTTGTGEDVSQITNQFEVKDIGNSIVIIASLEAHSGSTPHSITSVTLEDQSATFLGRAVAEVAGTDRNTIDFYYILDADLPEVGVRNVTVDYDGATDSSRKVYAWQLGGAAQKAPTLSSAFFASSTPSSNVDLDVQFFGRQGSHYIGVSNLGNADSLTETPQGMTVQDETISSVGQDVSFLAALGKGLTNPPARFSATSVDRMVSAVVRVDPIIGPLTRLYILKGAV